MTDTIIGAIIGAVAALLATIPPWVSEHNRRVAAQKEARDKENAAAQEKANERRERELNALQSVIDMSYDIQFFDNPSVAEFPDYSYARAADLRNTVLQAQGALPIDSQARATLEKMLDVTGELRQNYRKLERPVGQPDPIRVTPEDFKPYVQTFRDRLAPLLDDLKNRVQSAVRDRTQSAQPSPG